MKKKLLHLLTGCLAGFSTFLFSQTESPPPIDPATVVVLANSSNSDSMRIARKFMQLREIPENNLIAVPTAMDEKINRSVFNDSILNPFLKALREQKLVDALDGEIDSFGRQRLTIIENPIKYLVICYGVPIHILPATELEDTALIESYFKPNADQWREKIGTGPIAKNEASVDGEMILALTQNVPFTGFIPNPFFGNPQLNEYKDLLKVTRLDGPNPRSVLNLLNRTIEAEKSGLKGRAYIDEDGRDGAYQEGNNWLKMTAQIFSQLGFDTTEDTERKVMSETDRFDAPALYAGWYARSVTGAFNAKGFEFPAGAVAVHLHSFSAAPLRSTTSGWVGPLVDLGASATLGNTAEPYLALTHHYHLFFNALALGWSFADAAYVALPGLSWQSVAIGDPFYRPFKVSLNEQIQKAGDPLQGLQDQYVFMRQANLNLAANDPASARKIANRGIYTSPGPALALYRAQLLNMNGDAEATLKSLEFMRDIKPQTPAEAPLFADIAAMLFRLKAVTKAADIFADILALNDLSKESRIYFLEKGIPVADASEKTDLGRAWRAELKKLTSPQKPKTESRDSTPAN